MKICVFGASSRDLAQVYYDEAFVLGAELARRGHKIVFGGGTSGLMGAAARGAQSEGGYLIGVAPRFFDEPGVLHKCDEMIFTETMGERKKTMEDLADAFVVLPGGIGTFEEFLTPDGKALYAVFTDVKALADYVETYRGEIKEVWKEKILG